jgi:SAM-dependent methyltransferase
LHIVRNNAFLRRIYHDWYTRLVTALPTGDGDILELGSGAGFLHEYIPDLITSEVFSCPHVQMVVDAHKLPFSDESLRAIVMTNVLHHMPNCRRFFREAARCVRPGGVVTMIEPWATAWSRLIYRRFHHEPFDEYSPSWEFTSSGPLSGANQALAWVVFARDQGQFEAEFPAWLVREVRPFMPFTYLLSGGLSLRPFQPGWMYPVWRAFEGLLYPLWNYLAMFAHITLVRR